MSPHIQRTPQSRPPLPGLTSAVRGQWQSIGNTGMVCEVLAWGLCRFATGEQGCGYAIILGTLGVCGFLVELYGRLRYRKQQLPFPQGYSLCRYPGFTLAAAGAFLQWQSRQAAVALRLLCLGLGLFWASLVMDKLQRRRWREQREMEEN